MSAPRKVRFDEAVKNVLEAAEDSGLSPDWSQVEELFPYPCVVYEHACNLGADGDTDWWVFYVVDSPYGWEDRYAASVSEFTDMISTTSVHASGFVRSGVEHDVLSGPFPTLEELVEARQNRMDSPFAPVVLGDMKGPVPTVETDEIVTRLAHKGAEEAEILVGIRRLTS